MIQALNVATGILLARSLGPHGRGELAAVMLWPGVLAAVGSLGLVDAITYFAARRRTTLGKLVGSTAAVTVVQSAILVAAGLLVLPLFLGDYSGTVVTVARLFLLYIPLQLLAMNLTAVLNGVGRFSRFQTMRLLVILLSAAGLLLLAGFAGLTVERAAMVYLAAHLVTVAVTIRSLDVCWSSLRVDRGIARELLAFGVRSHGGSVASMLNERLDQLLISVFLAPAQLGLYVVAVALTSVTALIGSSTSLVALPSVAKLEPGPERDRTVRRLVSSTLLGCLAVTIPLFALVPVLISTFFGAAYQAAVAPARVLLVAAVVLSTNRVLSALLRAVGRPLDVGVAELLALAATALGLAALLPRFGLAGAAVTSLVAYATAIAWLARRASGALGIPVHQLLVPSFRQLTSGGEGSR